MGHGAPWERGVGETIYPCAIWRYQDLFLMPMGLSSTQNKPGDIVTNAVDGSGDRRRSHRGRSGFRWIEIAA